MADDFLGFKYKGIHSYNNDNFKAYIINEGEDLKFSNSPEFTLEFASPKFNEINYFLGETKESRSIQFDIWVEEVTLSDYKKFISWLTNNKQEDENNQQILSFDYNPDFGYNVKLASISDGTFYVVDNCLSNELKYNVELTVEFKTIGDWAAQYLGPTRITLEESTSISIENLFTFTPNPSNESLEIDNNGTLPIYLKITFREDIPSSESSFKITVNEEDWLEFPRISDNITVFTKFGLVWDNESKSFLRTTINKGAIEIPPGETTTITFSSSEAFEFGNIGVEAILREII